MITDGLPISQPARVIDCGQPWHGLCEASWLDYGGASPMAWAQPDSSDCWVVRVPGAPGSAQAVSVNPDHQWLDYGILSGWWERQLYGQVLPGGRHSYIYSAGLGATYVVDLSDMAFTDANTKLGGSLDLHATRVSHTPPESIALAPDSLDLGASYAIRDAIAFSSDGSQAILGVWPSSYLGTDTTYTQGADTRALARIIYAYHDYRVMPHMLLTLDISESEAILATLKTPAQMAEHTQNDYLSESGGDPETGEGYWQTAYNYQTWRKIVGAYYKDDGSIAYVIYQYRIVFDWSRVENVGSGIETHHMELIVDGATCSALTYVVDWELQDLGVPIGLAPVRGTAFALAVDDADLPDMGMHNGTIAGVKPDPTDMVASFSLWEMVTPAAERYVVVHAIRYSNHAWGLAILGLNAGIHGSGNTAYLGGVVNTLSGLRGVAPGYIDAVTYAEVLDALHVSVHPDTAATSQGSAPQCWV